MFSSKPNKKLLNDFSNYIPNKIISIDDKDSLRMTDEIESEIKKRDMFYQQLKKDKLNLIYFDVINELTSEFSSSQKRGEFYFQLIEKLSDSQTNA